LTTVGSFTTQDIATAEGGGLLYSYSRKVVPQIGREMAGGAFYDTTTKKEQIIQAITPAVAQSRGKELTTFNRQILLANSTLDAAKSELGQRTTDDVEARQPQTLFNPTLANAMWWMSPSDALWHKWTIPANTNNRGISVDTTVRWTLRSMTIDFDIEKGVPIVNPEYKLETQGGDFQTLTTTPINSGVQFFDPVVPLAPVYDAYPEEAGNTSPDTTDLGAAGNEPPFDPGDEQMVSKPQDPSTAYGGGGISPDGTIAVVWNDTQIWGGINVTTSPAWFDITPASMEGTIQDFEFNTGSNLPGGWLLTSDDDNSYVYRTDSVRSSVWNPTETTITGLYTQIRETPGAPKQDRVNIYCPDLDAGTWEYTFDSSTDLSSWAAYATGSSPSGARAVWTGTGWKSNPGPDNRETFIQIDSPTFSFAAALTSATITLSTAPPSSVSYQYWSEGHIPDPPQDNDSSTAAAVTFTVSSTADEIGVGIDAGFDTGTLEIIAITLRGTGPNPFGAPPVENSAIRRSTNGGQAFGAEIIAGDSISGAPFGGFDSYSFDDTVFAATQDKIVESTNGGAFTDVTGGDTASRYAKAIKIVGRSSKDFIFGTNIPLSGDALWDVVGGVATGITPNDGSFDGLVVGANCLESQPRNASVYFALMQFAGTTKLAYSTNSGSTWSFNTQIGNDAIHIAVINANGKAQIKTGAIVLADKIMPALDVWGVEVWQ
jgi:hypothetical protein